ncbi:hypothetical protein C8Q74DRAFT_1217582 [Fomes fomentarius]|nr:hypothetical protein C8Q74DRAFT_1217582 [Fomes fomentarius]
MEVEPPAKKSRRSDVDMQSHARPPDHSAMDDEFRSHSLFTEEELDRWAQTVASRIPTAPEPDPHFVLSVMVDVIRADKPHVLGLVKFHPDEAAQLVDMYPSLKDLIQARNFRSILSFTSGYLPFPCAFTRAREQHSQYVERTESITLKSWRTPFRGSTDTFRAALKQRMQQGRQYARYAWYTQSSGTGKSRMIDELAKTVFCIPVNLNPDAFPPMDKVAVRWLMQTPSHSDYTLGVEAFLYAVFSTTREFLEERVVESGIELDALESPQRVARLAELFRTKMSENMQLEEHGQYRQSFYNAVDEKAEKFREEHRKEVSSYIHGEKMIMSAADALLKFLDPTSGETREGPLVLLCFDGAFKLSDADSRIWTRFSALTRALHVVVNQPVFSIFLSTMGDARTLSQPELSASSRTATTLQSQSEQCKVPPILFTTFDVFSRKLSGNKWTLRQVASTSHIAHLGRPLFAATYDAGTQRIKEEIVNIASCKLFNTTVSTIRRPTTAQMLAGVGARIPLELKILSTTGAATGMESTLVSDHLRLLLSADVSFTRSVTAYASEPLLAEAAYKEVIRDRWCRGKTSEPAIPSPLIPIIAIPRISSDLDLNIDLGIHGEIVAAMLLLDARDRATTFLTDHHALPGDSDEADSSADPLEYDGGQKRRIITVQQFMEALISDVYRQSCLDSLPMPYLPKHKDTMLSDAFKDAHIYFNHLVRVLDFDAVDQQRLLTAISRGAAFISAPPDNKEYDILIPILFGTLLKREKVSAILIRVTNSERFTKKIHRSMYVTTHPLRAGIFDEDAKSPPPPVIRIVFALASKTSAVSVRVRAEHARPSKYTAYDLWFAGVTPETFGVIQNADEGRSVGGLVVSSRDQHDVFKMYAPYGDSKMWEVVQDMRRSMQPLASRHMAHFTNFIADTDFCAQVDLADEESDDEIEESEDEDEEVEVDKE